MKFILSITLLLLLASSGVLLAQGGYGERYGHQAYVVFEAQQNQLVDIYPMLYNQSLFPSRDLEDLYTWSGGIRFGMMSSFDNTPFFTTFDVGVFSYHIAEEPLEGGHFQLSNSEGLRNRIIFDHDRLSFGFAIGVRVPKESTVCVFLKGGARWDLLFGQNVRYNSNQPQFDLDIRQSLEDGTSQRNNFTVGGTLGIGVLMGRLDVSLSADLYRGLVDVLRTEANPFLWSDPPTNKLHTRSASPTISYLL